MTLWEFSFAEPTGSPPRKPSSVPDNQTETLPEAGRGELKFVARSSRQEAF